MATVSTDRSSTLAPLLAGYISGDVTDAVMAIFDDLFGADHASTEERAAFARFYLDALDAGEFADALPHPSEVAGILAVARA